MKAPTKSLSKKILGVDPGCRESAFVQWDGQTVFHSGILPNQDLLELFRGLNSNHIIAVEMIRSYGMAVGEEIFNTCLMIGRIMEIAHVGNIECHLVYRGEVKIHHCKSARATDSNIRQTLIDKYGPPGTRKNPGPTYGCVKHIWSALAIATYLTETNP